MNTIIPQMPPNNALPDLSLGASGQNPVSPDAVDAGKKVDNSGVLNLFDAPSVGGGAPPVGDKDPLNEPEEVDSGALQDTELKLSGSFSLNDLYAILVLLQDCANKQRAAAREVRQADYESQKQAILGEAAKTESAALAGMITGVVGATLSAGMTLLSAFSGCKGIKGKLEKLGEYNVGKFSKNLSKASGKLNDAGKALKNFKADMAKKYPAEVPDAGPNQVAPGGKPGGKVDGKGIGNAKPVKEPLTELGDKIDQSKMSKADMDKWNSLKGKYNDAAGEVKAAQNDLDHVMEQLSNDPEFINAEQKIQHAGLMQAGAQTLSSFCSTLSQTLNQLFQASATVEGAKVKDAEQESDQENDLFQQAGQLRQEVIQLLQALNQIEKDSLGKVVNAI